MTYIYDLTLDELKQHLTAMGEPKFRAAQIFPMLHKGYDVADIPNIPKELRSKLETTFNTKLPEIVNQQISKDGTKKFLLSLEPKQELIECVLLSAEYGHTVCVSSQVGCRMGCKFCASGREGFIRNLTAGEILAQVILAHKLSGSDSNTIRIVLMGSGEPLDNFDNVMKFIALATDKHGLNISSRNISLSTVGLSEQMRRFADMFGGVNLCISIHASNDSVRQKLIPMARKYKIAEIIDAAKYFFDKTRRRVIFEYSLVDGVNCAPEHAVELAKLVRGFPNHINLILVNETVGADGNQPTCRPPAREVAMKFMDTLIKNGASTTFRKSRGNDIDAACGMLKLKKSTQKL